MQRKPSFRKSLRDERIEANAGMKHYALLSGKPMPDGLLNDVAPKRERAKPALNTEPTEADIQRAILDYMRVHPKVAWAHRFNRGMAQGSYNGRESYVRFNTCKGFSDIHALLVGGRAMYVEVKRPGKKATDEQADFLASCTAAGALALVACNIEDVMRALRG